MPLYTPGLAAGISTQGNTSGTTGLLAQQLLLVGGNNITLSQSVNAQSATLTISAGVGGAGGSNTLGMSNLGNTAGATGVVSDSAVRFVFVGGNNVTLSQSLNGASGTITISAANETQTVPPIATAGKQVASARSTGTITRFAPEDHAHEGLAQFQISGNTSNTSNVVLGSLVFAGGNNITLSQVSAAGAATITISAANETQTVPPIATAVKAAVSTVASTGSITRFAPEDHQHQGVNSIGMSNLGNTSGTSSVAPGRFVLAGGNNVTLSQATDATGSTLSISGAGSAVRVSAVEWNRGGMLEAAVSLTGASFSQRPIFFPAPFPHGGISASTVRVYISAAVGTTLNMTAAVGFYTLANSSSMNLVSSTTHAFSLTASSDWSGLRALEWTGMGALNLTEGLYYVGLLFSASNTSTAVCNLNLLGVATHPVIVGSILPGTNSSGASNSSKFLFPMWGVWNATSGALPSAVARSSIAGGGGSAVIAAPYVGVFEI